MPYAFDVGMMRAKWPDYPPRASTTMASLSMWCAMSNAWEDPCRIEVFTGAPITLPGAYED